MKKELKKTIYKYISNSIVILSLLFVLIHLRNVELLRKLTISNYFILIMSLLSVFFGFIIDALIIKIYLKQNKIPLPISEAIILSGKYSLAKYIPGKIGVIIGKATYLSDKTNVNSLKSIEIITIYQLLFVVSGIIFSLATSYNYLNNQSKNIVIIMILILICMILFSFKSSQLILNKILIKIFKRDFTNNYSQRAILYVLFGTMSCWISWTFGFWMLAKSVGIDISIKSAMVFPLAAIAGVIVLISPGGLGVREGIIAAGLIFWGYDKIDSVSLSIYSRLWFLICEISFFLFTIIISFFNKKKL